MPSWDEINSLSEQEMQDLLQASVDELEALLTRDANAEGRLLELLGRRLSDPIDTETLTAVRSSLIYYLGENGGPLLIWISSTEQAGRLANISAMASPEVISLIRAVLGLYGQELEKAYALWNEIPDNWKTIYRHVYFDKINGNYLLRIRVEKYNGEMATIEGNADQLMDLTRHFILALRLVGVPDAFSQDRVSEFLEEVDVLRELIEPPTADVVQ
jgi:hypothetical protein